MLCRPVYRKGEQFNAAAVLNLDLLTLADEDNLETSISVGSLTFLTVTNCVTDAEYELSGDRTRNWNESGVVRIGLIRVPLNMRFGEVKNPVFPT